MNYDGIDEEQTLKRRIEVDLQILNPLACESIPKEIAIRYIILRKAKQSKAKQT